MQICKRVKKMVSGVVLTGFLLMSGCGQQTTSGVPPLGGVPEVAVVTIKARRLVVTTELTGRTAPYRVAEVRPQVGGIIRKRMFTEGSDVKARQVLFRPFIKNINAKACIIDCGNYY